MKISRPVRRGLAAALCPLFLSACAETQLVVHSAKEIAGTGADPVAKTKGSYKVGNPYRIKNTWYYPAEDFDYVETGVASWYGPKFHGRKTANGETFDMNTLTAAHRTLPMPSSVRVINLSNGRSIILRVNDRGPFARNRIIDVSRRAAQLLGFQRQGTARVRVEIMAEESQRLKLAALNGKLPAEQRIAEAPDNREPVVRRPLQDGNGAARAAEPAPAAPVQTKVPRTAENSPRTVEKIPTPGENRLFVQAGAFVDYVNASKVRSRLSEHGPAWLSEARVGRQKFYRVRIGPMQSLDNADRVLARLISSGFPKARIVVD